MSEEETMQAADPNDPNLDERDRSVLEMQKLFEEMSFRVLRRSVPNFVIAYAEIRLRKGQRLVRMDTNIKDGQVPLAETTQDDIISCFLKYYAMVLDSDQQAAQ